MGNTEAQSSGGQATTSSIEINGDTRTGSPKRWSYWISTECSRVGAAAAGFSKVVVDPVDVMGERNQWTSWNRRRLVCRCKPREELQ